MNSGRKGGGADRGTTTRAARRTWIGLDRKTWTAAGNARKRAKRADRRQGGRHEKGGR